MSIFGQVWLWSLVAFVVGVLLSWVFLARPAQARNRVLERQLLDAKNASAAERQAPPTRTLDRGQEPASDARSFDGGAAAATQVVPGGERGDAAPRTGWYERDSFGDAGSRRESFDDAAPGRDSFSDMGASGREDFGDAGAEQDSFVDAGPGHDGGSFGSVLNPESDAERTTYFTAAPQSDAESLLGGPVDPEQVTRFDEQYGNAAAMGRDSVAGGTRFDSDSPYGAHAGQDGVLGGSPDSFGAQADEGRAFGGDFGERQGQRHSEQSNVDPGALYGESGSGRDYQDESREGASHSTDEPDDLIRRFTGDAESRGFAGGLGTGQSHEPGEQIESWRQSAGDSLEPQGQQAVGEEYGQRPEELGQRSADEQPGAHGRRALDERAGSGFDSGAGQPDVGQSRHSLPADDGAQSGADKLPRRIPGGHRLNPNESAMDGPGSLFGTATGRGEQGESPAASLFDDGSSRGRGSLFEPGALPDADSRADTGTDRGAHAAGDAWSQPFSAGGRPDEEPPAYAFSKDVDPEDVNDEQSAEATTVLPKRQPRSTPRGSFEPPRPSMRSIERRETAAPSTSEGERSGSLFEPTVQRNEPAGAPAAADIDAPTTFEAPVSPPARSTPEAASVPPGPFGPGSAMPRPGGARPAEDFAVKASVTALRYCTEESPQFGRMVAEVWFRSAEDAERVGFRPLS